MKSLIVANWKCNPTTLHEAKRLFNSIKTGIRENKNIEAVICPPFLYLLNLKSKILNLKLGAQDCFWEQKGAFTGEISPAMLKNLGCEYVIIGHSERRALGETDEIINKKLQAAMEKGLKPILCIGETEKERKEGKTKAILKEQLEKALINSSTHKFINLIIAYEPVWAIGTAKACHPNEAKEVLLFLRKILKKNRILYGGSVNCKNAAGYIKKARMNGLLVGGASLDPEEFVALTFSLKSLL